MRSPQSRPGQDEYVTSQTSIRHHPQGRMARKVYAVAPIHTGGVALRHLGPRDATWAALSIPTWVGRTSLAFVVLGNSSRVTRLGPHSPARWSRAGAWPTSPAPGSGPWPPGRPSAAAGQAAGHARSRRERPVTDVGPARRARPRAGGRPARPRG